MKSEWQRFRPLQSDGDSARAAALVKMLTLKRPLALYLQNDEPIVAWLQEQQVGTEIYVTATDSVWLVEPSVATLGQLQITLSNGTRMMHVEVGKPAPMQSSHDVESATTDVSN
ncbi:MAG: hypothetical protein R2932_00350 [Caldilineaceae bacterium]